MTLSAVPGVRRELFDVRAGGRRLAAARLHVEGGADGPAVLFLHEGLGCIGFWRDFPELLCAALRRPGLLYDRWGYGGSEPFDQPRHARYLHDEALAVLPELLRACGIVRPVLFGHSDGGTIALLHAASFPGAQAAVVTLAAHVMVEEVTLQGIRLAEAAHAEPESRLRRALARHHGDQAGAVFAAWADTWLAPEFRRWDIRAEIDGIRDPLLVMQGADDAYGSLAQVDAIAAAARGRCERRLIPACGHAPHLERPEAVIAAVIPFLAAHVPAAWQETGRSGGGR